MAKLMRKWFQVLVLSGAAVTGGAWAVNEADPPMTKRPGYGVAVMDAIFVRPVSLAATLLGTMVFVVTSPITAITGTIGEAGQTLVVEPALTTFYRCLGCTDTGWREFPAADPADSTY